MTAEGEGIRETTCHRPARWYNPDTNRCEHPEHDAEAEAPIVSAAQRFYVWIRRRPEAGVTPEEWRDLGWTDSPEHAAGVIRQHRARARSHGQRFEYRVKEVGT